MVWSTFSQVFRPQEKKRQGLGIKAGLVYAGNIKQVYYNESNKKSELCKRHMVNSAPL